jgi:hypothetical protein
VRRSKYLVRFRKIVLKVRRDCLLKLKFRSLENWIHEHTRAFRSSAPLELPYHPCNVVSNRFRSYSFQNYGGVTE